MKYLGYVLCVLSGIVLGYVVFSIDLGSDGKTTFGVTEMREGGGKLTNPLLECVNSQDEGPMNQLSISKFDLNKFINNITNSGKVTTVSLYVRDMNNGPWIGINSNEEFIGASLFKVPVLIAYMKLAESDPSILKKEIEFKTNFIPNTDYFPPSKAIEPGNKYTIQQLLEYMIEYSDNNAADLLFKNIDRGEIDKVFGAIGKGLPDFNQPYPVNTTTYAGFFRILFNSSYLSKDSSEKALDMLTKTEFKRGLVADLTDGTVVAHKFGINADNGINQLHDCGIVYYPKHPYLICIMTKGGDYDDLAKAIADVSKFVFDQVSNNK